MRRYAGSTGRCAQGGFRSFSSEVWFAGGLSGICGVEHWEAQGISEEAWNIRRTNEGTYLGGRLSSRYRLRPDVLLLRLHTINCLFLGWYI